MTVHNISPEMGLVLGGASGGNGDEITMSSRQIAEVCGKRHDNVMADIAKMLSDIGKDALTFQGIYEDAYGREKPCYHLPEDLVLTLVTGYRADLRYKMVKEIERLRRERSGPAIDLPNFFDPVAAARAWADAQEARLIAERTKAQIGARREATAMNTASQAVKRANRLEKELDRSREYASVKRMEKLHHGIKFKWRELKYVSQEMGLPPIDIFDANYGTVKAYHADVWRECYALEIIGMEGAA